MLGLLAALAIVVGAAACGDDDDSPTAAGVTSTSTVDESSTTTTLFSAAADTVGITDDSINVCIHAALQVAERLGTGRDDLPVYWEAVNADGGIHGRQVEITYTDDLGTPQGGTQAAQQCDASDAFVMGGSVGFDTVPAVRQFAEENDLLYFSSFATEADISRYTHSFSFQPSIERLADVVGRFVTAEMPDSTFGVIWRNSPNWEGGSDQFRSAVIDAGGEVVSDIPVEANQGDFTNAILNLKQSGADVVLAWVPVLDSVQLIQQSHAQGYKPTWILSGFNVVAELLGTTIDGTDGPAAIGFSVVPPFPAGEGAEFQQEVERMTAAFERFRPEKAASLTDTDWAVWLFSAQLHRLLEDCGPDCTRNHLVDLLLDGYAADMPPICAVDFARGEGRLGGFAVDLYRAEPTSGGPQWTQLAHCTEGS